MNTLQIIIIIGFFLSLGMGALLIILVRKRTPPVSPPPVRGLPEEEKPEPVRPSPVSGAETFVFRWRYVALPLLILVLTAIMVAFFYRLLPEEVAFRFRTDGTPYSITGRGPIVLWTLLPQVLLSMMALVITWGITRFRSMLDLGRDIEARLGIVLMLMGNMVGLPQLILFFAMLDIFVYNSYQVHLLPLWLMAIIVMALGTVVLGIHFARAFRQVKGVSNQPNPDNKE